MRKLGTAATLTLTGLVGALVASGCASPYSTTRPSTPTRAPQIQTQEKWKEGVRFTGDLYIVTACDYSPSRAFALELARNRAAELLSEHVTKGDGGMVQILLAPVMERQFNSDGSVCVRVAVLPEGIKIYEKR